MKFLNNYLKKRKIKQSQNRILKSRDFLLRKCADLKFDLKTIVIFTRELPFHFSLKDTDEFKSFFGIRETHLFSSFINIKNDYKSDVLLSSSGISYRKTKVSTIDFCILMRNVNPDEMNVNLLLSAERFAYTSLNAFIVHYMAASNDLESSICLPLESKDEISFSIYNNFFIKMSELHFCTIGKSENEIEYLSSEVLSSLLETSQNSLPDDSIIFSIYYKMLAQKKFNNGDYRAATIEIQTYVETIICKLVLSIRKDLTLNFISKKSFNRVLNSYLFPSLGWQAFEGHTEQTDENKYVFQYVNYCVSLRNKVIHSSYFPHEFEVRIAIDAALNFVGLVFDELDKKNPDSLNITSKNGLILKNIDEDIKSLKIIFPELYS